MGLIAWSDEKIKRFNSWDIAALKLYAAIFGLVLGAYISEFVKKYLVVFIVVFILLGTWLCYKMLKKERK